MSQNKYYIEIYKEIADLYIIDRLSIPKACAKAGITKKTYYNICKKLGAPSVATMKDARLDYISNDSINFEANNIDEHDSVN